MNWEALKRLPDLTEIADQSRKRPTTQRRTSPRYSLPGSQRTLEESWIRFRAFAVFAVNGSRVARCGFSRTGEGTCETTLHCFEPEDVAPSSSSLTPRT